MAEARAPLPFALIAEFASPSALLKAAELSRREGFRDIDAFTPFPIDGLALTIGFQDNRVPLWSLAGGLIGGIGGYAMQVYINLDYPLNVGGRALIANPAFVLIVFELTVLFAVTFSIGSMLLLNRLPRLHHPLFDLERFHLASLDRFFLLVSSDDVRFDRERARRFLESLAPVRVEEVPSEGFR
jgi:hypothetical protein